MLYLVDSGTAIHPQPSAPPVHPAHCTSEPAPFPPYLQLPPRARSFSGVPEQLLQTPCRPSFPVCFLGKGRAGSECAPPAAHRHSTCHVITYFTWPEQLQFHKTAKQDLCLGWSGEGTPSKDLPLASGQESLLCFLAPLAAPTLGVC